MATIVSLSLNEKILKQLDKVQDEMGFSGRSDATRAAIRLLVTDNELQKKISGPMNAVLTVVHKDTAPQEIEHIRHEHAKIIKTQLHDHLDNHTCIELFMLKGDGKEIRTITKKFSTAKSVLRAALQPL